MKRASLKVKITLWFTAAMLVVVAFTYFVILSVSNQILQKTIRDNLIETVENNFNEIIFHSSIDEIDTEMNASHFLQFGEGVLEVDDDFLDAVNEVYTALYSSDESLLYGENPISRQTRELGFSDLRIQRLRVNGVLYYVFDRRLEPKGASGLWLRGVVSETQGTAQTNTITGISLVILPVIMLIAAIGGYFIVKRMLRPIQQISDTAKQIGRDNDLKKRIELGNGSDELHQLADTFNEMFDKLESNFETERRFISDASHELRTPTSVISAQCEYSLERPQNSEEYIDALNVISRQSRKLTRLIGDMLDFTRLELGTERYAMGKVNMTELVTSVSSDMALLRERGITLRYRTEENIAVKGNSELLTRLLTNLISNAYRYGKENGHILVELAAKAEKICVSVADDGIGIAKEEQEKIFGRFYRVDGSRSGAGIGLGLAMANEIARFHNGCISVESELGAGSTFTFSLQPYNDESNAY